MVNYERLTKAGINMTTLTARLMGNTALIKLFVGKFVSDGNYAALVSAFAAGDAKAAEMASHTLKGMCGNMSLDTLFGLYAEQTNRIRAGDLAGAEAMMATIGPLFGETIAEMQAWLAEGSM